MAKKVKIINVSKLLEGTIKVGDEYEVLHTKRDEYCIRINESIMGFVWKSDAELIED